VTADRPGRADQPDQPGLQDLLAIAVEAASTAARLVVDERPQSGRRLEVTATKSSATDIVTEMDKLSERTIVDLVTRARPDDGFLGEEGADRAGTSGVTWVIDPIDGSVNYLYEIPAYAVSIAARDADGVLVGVVVNPVSGETWTAVRGGGAFLDGRRLRLDPPPPMELALVATGFSYGSARRARQADILRSVLPLVRDVRRIGSAALDLCAVATGRVDAFYEQGLNPWDLAAGGLVAAEAGAVVAGLPGQEAGEALVVAAHPGLYEPLAQLLGGLGADDLVEG
jgi:myo-inositol-1(or 4)-monophosphatase